MSHKNVLTSDNWNFRSVALEWWDISRQL